MINRFRVVAVSALVSCALCGAARAEDKLELKNGNSLFGRVLEETEKKVVFEFRKGSITGKVTFSRDEVAKITRDVEPQEDAPAKDVADEPGPPKDPEPADRATDAEQEPDAPKKSIARGDHVAAYVARALEIAEEEGKEDEAYYALLNAKLFGRRSKEVNAALKACTPEATGISLTDEDPKGLEDVARCMKMFGALGASMPKLRRKVRVEAKWDQIEARMLLDRKLVGDGKCVLAILDKANGQLDFTKPSGGGSHRFIGFLRRNTLSVRDVARKYGVPQQTLKATNGMKFYYYGRIMLALEKNAKRPFVFRF